MYQHWFIKSGLYKVDAIACERNGMGVPTITMGGNKITQQDRDAATGWVTRLTTHQSTGIVFTTPGWTVIRPGRSKRHHSHDPKDSIVHHNMAIAMAGLAQFMVMGQSHSSGGNRALGQTMSDFFYLSLQGTANHIARIITQTTIKRLVDYNFAGVKNYPKLIPQQILSVNFQDVVEALKELASSTVDAVRPDDELGKVDPPEDRRAQGWTSENQGRRPASRCLELRKLRRVIPILTIPTISPVSLLPPIPL